MGLLEAGETWLRSVRRAAVAISIDYQQGADVATGINATRAKTDFESDDGETIVKSSMVDWLVDRSEFALTESLRADSDWLTADAATFTADDTDGTRVLPASGFEPQIGDTITVIYDHGTEVFKVAEMAGEPCWRWHGRDGGTFRIHSVRV